MKYFFKILSILLIILAIYINFIASALSLSEGYNIFSPYIDTEFAPNFTIEKSKKIKVGMSKTEVVKILGNPLHKDKSYYGNNLQFNYTNDGLVHRTKNCDYTIICDFAWFGYGVVFNDQDKVIEIVTGWCYD